MIMQKVLTYDCEFELRLAHLRAPELV